MYWQSLIFLVLKCSEIDHPHHFFTESFGAHALIYLIMKSKIFMSWAGQLLRGKFGGLDQLQYLWLNSTLIISCTLKCMKQRENLVSSSLDSSMLPLQFTPSPKYPGLQVHVKERLVLVQYASSWQLCCPVLHSSTNQQVEVLVLKLIWV